MELFSGPQYLAIDIANNFGKDKEIYEVRLDWFEQEVLPIINNDASLNKLIKEADSPALMVQGIYAYRSYMHKEPVYYPVSFDAVASGIQINSTLTRCERGMLLTGILPTYRRPSPYLSIHEELAKNGLKLDLDYETTKSMVMRKNYGSEATARNILKDPDKVSLFDKVMYEMLPGASLLNQSIIKLWDVTAFNYKWVMPDNFHVFVEVKNTYSVPIMDNTTFTNIELSMPENWGRSLSPNFTHSIDGMIVRELVNRCSIGKKRKEHLLNLKKYNKKRDDRRKDKTLLRLLELYNNSKFMSTRILNFVDKENIGLVPTKDYYELLQTIPNHKFDIISNHDCFRSLPNYMNILRKQYNIIIGELYKSNIPEYILSNLTGTPQSVFRFNYDETTYKLILEADYALT